MALVAAAILAGLWFGRDLSAPAKETNAQLDAVKAAVLAFAETEGGTPPHLDALVTGGFLDAVPENRSGFPLLLRILDDGRVEIVDFGPDGKEGGFMFKKDHRIRFEVR
jgi:hypothetical protein